MSQETNPRFNIGDVVAEKACPKMRMVIMKVKKRFFNRGYKYRVCWWSQNDFHNGTAKEFELDEY